MQGLCPWEAHLLIFGLQRRNHQGSGAVAWTHEKFRSSQPRPCSSQATSQRLALWLGFQGGRGPGGLGREMNWVKVGVLPPGPAQHHLLYSSGHARAKQCPYLQPPPPASFLVFSKARASPNCLSFPRSSGPGTLCLENKSKEKNKT